MATSQILRQLYANPLDEVILPTVEIQLAGGIVIRAVIDQQDHILGGELYEASPITLDLPKRTKGERQRLSFRFAMLDDRYMNQIQDAIESGNVSYVTYSEWLESDKTTPIKRYPTMPILGGTHEPISGAFSVEASYQDLLDTNALRQRFTAQNAPGVRYL